MWRRVIIIIGIILLVVIGMIVLVLQMNHQLGNANNQNIQTTNTVTNVNQSNSNQNINQSQGQARVRIYLAAIDDRGQQGRMIGCGDSLVYIEKNVPSEQANIKGALTELFAIKTQTEPGSGHYNALYRSNLGVEEAVIENGVAKVSLTGTMQLGGTCDSPRFSEQILATIRQFPGVQDTDVTINGQPMEDALSQRGE